METNVYTKYITDMFKEYTPARTVKLSGSGLLVVPSPSNCLLIFVKLLELPLEGCIALEEPLERQHVERYDHE